MRFQSKYNRTTSSSSCGISCFLSVVLAFLSLYNDMNDYSSSSNYYYVSGEVIRKNNLDYFDVETMNFFINPYSIEIDYDELDDNDSIHGKTITNYDVIILFYAQWCKNCHALAPSYDTVASTLNSGTNKQSKLIMGLFDCEKNIQHSQICTTINIQHYPTIYYISLSTLPRTNTNTPNNNVATTTTSNSKSKSKRTFNKPPKHFTLFTGNWQYGEMILYDWIVSMRSISIYYNSKFRSSTNIIGNLVSKLFTSKNKKKDTNNNNLDSFLGMNTNNKDKSSSSTTPTIKKTTTKKNRGLPIGIPGISSSTGTSTGTSTDSSSNSNTISLVEYNKLKKQYETSKQVESRNTIIIDSMLTPSIIPEVNSSNSRIISSIHRNSTLAIQVPSSSLSYNTNITPKVYVDMFTYMNVTNVWTSVLSNTTSSTSTTDNDNDNDIDSKVLFTCIFDLSYDYCTRINNLYMYKWINSNPTINDITDSIYEQYNIQREQYLQTIEPYCIIIDECIGTNFKPITSTTTTNNTNSNTNCRPLTCPFYDDTACRYLTSCLSDDLYNVYNTAYVQQQQKKEQQQKQTNYQNQNNQNNQNSIPITKSTTSTTTSNSFGNKKNDIPPPPPKQQSTYATKTASAGDDGRTFGSLNNGTTTAATAATTGTSAEENSSSTSASSSSSTTTTTSNNRKWGLR